MFHVGSANFSNLFADGQNSFVSQVSQETFIEVNELGTEAAAATGLGLSATSIGSSFTANRPFLFQIVDHKTKTVLFSGRVKNPLDSVDSSAVDCRVEETTFSENEETTTVETTPGPEREVEKVLMGLVTNMSRTVSLLESRMKTVEEILKIEEDGESTTLTPNQTKFPQEYLQSLFSSSAWGYAETGGGMIRWAYRPVFPVTCANLVGSANTVFLDGACVMLYRLEGCAGEGFKLDQKNSHLGHDIRRQFPSAHFPGFYTDPKSIGICLG